MKTMLLCAFVLMVLSCHVAISSAYPPRYEYTDRIDGDVNDFRAAQYFREDRDLDDYYNYRNSRRRRVYYYDDDGYVYYPYRTTTPYPYVPDRTPIRREGTDPDATKKYKYTPIVRYKSTHTKRKKLFVPNLWG